MSKSDNPATTAGWSVNTGLRALASQRIVGIMAFLLGISLVVALIQPRFAQVSNIAVLCLEASFVALVSFGQMLVMIAADIDLSVGAVAGLGAIASAAVMGTLGLPPLLGILAGLLAGAIIGLINGLLVTKFELNAFITTLSVSFVIQGVILVVTGGSAVRGVPESVRWLGQGTIGIVPVPVVIMILVGVVIAVVLRFTRSGRHLFIVGGNREAAVLTGVNVDRIRIGAFVASSALASMAGMLMMARLASGQPTIGGSWLLPSFAAPVIGGTSMTGGVGGPLGTIVGALIMAVLNNAIVVVGISSYWQQVVVGLALIVAIFIDRWKVRQSARALKAVSGMPRGGIDASKAAAPVPPGSAAGD